MIILLFYFNDVSLFYVFTFLACECIIFFTPLLQGYGFQRTLVVWSWLPFNRCKKYEWITSMEFLFVVIVVVHVFRSSYLKLNFPKQTIQKVFIKKSNNSELDNLEHEFSFSDITFYNNEISILDCLISKPSGSSFW